MVRYTAGSHVIRIALGGDSAMLGCSLFPDTQPSLLHALRSDNDNGRGSAWSRFFEFYAPPIFRLARRRGLTVHDSDEIVQQVMISVAAHIDEFSYDANQGRFRGWVRTIASNKVIDALRLRRNQRSHVDAGELDNIAACEPPTNSDPWEKELRIQTMILCMERLRLELAPNHFEAFRLYVLEQMPADEAAARVGLTRTHVYVIRSRVIARLRELVDEFQSRND